MSLPMTQVGQQCPIEFAVIYKSQLFVYQTPEDMTRKCARNFYIGL